MKAYGEEEMYVSGQLHAVAALPPGAMLPISRVVGLVSPTASLDALVKRKIFWPCWKLCFLHILLNKFF
jgi:hypothetical protein